VKQLSILLAFFMVLFLILNACNQEERDREREELAAFKDYIFNLEIGDIIDVPYCIESAASLDRCSFVVKNKNKTHTKYRVWLSRYGAGSSGGTFFISTEMATGEVVAIWKQT